MTIAGHRAHTIYAAVIAALVLAALLVGDPSTASTPNSGTLTNSTGPRTWTGGPFAAPNATGTAGDVDCTAPQSCDDYALTLATRPGTGDTRDMRISVKWTNTAADFDVYVLNSAGAVIESSASSSDPETVIMPPTSGTYTVRVVPYLPLGSSYSASAGIIAKPSDSAPPSDARGPRFAAYGAPEALGDAHNAGEPSIGFNTQTGTSAYQSYLSTYAVKFDDSVRPATATWSDVSASATNGCPQGSTQSLDPILYTDRETGRTFESQLSGADSLTCYTDDDGVTWNPSTGGGIPSGVDHQTLGGGPFVAGDTLNATNTYPNAVYYCSQDIATAFCALSRDGGVTFGAGVPVYSLLDCGGLHGHVMVAPDGTAYLPNKSCNGKQGVTVSTDNGKTWTVRTVPNSLPGDNDPAVAIGANGTVYFGYANADGTQHVAVSRNQGKTWVDDYNVGSSFHIRNVVFPTAVAGDDDRAAVSFIGTGSGGNYQDAANFKGVWYLYTAFTYDGGKTWKTVRDTLGDPVQRGSICTGGTTCGNDRNLLDFIGSTIDSRGRVEVGFADGCTGACVQGTTNNFDAYASIARQYDGLTLFSADDPRPDFTITRVTAGRNRNGHSHISAWLKNIGTAAGSVPVRFFVDGKVLATSTTRQLRPGHLIQVNTGWNVTERSTHRILAVADPSNASHELNEANNRLAATVVAP